MTYIGPEDDFDPKDPLAPRPVRGDANARSSLTLSQSKFDEMLQEAIRESVRQLENEQDQTRGLARIVSFVAGIGVSAIIVFVFFVLIPKLSQTTVTQPAASEFTSTIAPAGGDKPTPEESEALLRKFIQWQQRK
jgi:hypothetical protein